MTDWSILRVAVIGLILCGVVTVLAVTFLLWSGSTAPDGLIAIAGTSVGALATLMVTGGERRHSEDRDPSGR